MSKTIFIIDDEPDMLRDAKDLLTDQGYQVKTSLDPVKGLAQISEQPPDLVLLDVSMPKMDGFEVCRKIKGSSKTRHVPVVLVSIKTHEMNVISGLELGAEDYIRKPYQEGEFLARIRRAILRNEMPNKSKPTQCGPFQLDYQRYTIEMDGKPVNLRPKEFELLAFFIEHEGHVLTHATISEKVWKTEHIPTSKTIYFQVEQLRKKLGKYARFLTSLKGIGYRFEIDEE